MSKMSEIDMLRQTHCCSQCDQDALEREAKLADQCMTQHDMIKAQAELIDNLREELRSCQK